MVVLDSQLAANEQLIKTNSYFYFQKEMFASKVDSGGNVGVGVGSSSNVDYSRERKLSSTSSTGSMKNKWVKAFKSIKGGKEPPVEPR